MGRIQHRAIKPTWKPEDSADYARFDLLDGQHSWQKAVPDGCVLYPARKLNTGTILYFNFDLAREMGLLPPQHKNVMTKDLEKKILDTFSIRIINEYDQSQNLRYHPSVLKPHPYMATRYLQLQHKDKCGRTSGDGRSVWNGQITYNGTTWDVSSRGTGVTRLSPGAVEAQKPLKSGSAQFGYGCGMADVDELIGSAIMAEIFHNNGLNTERVLTIIDIGGGNGIGVRAAPNLFRPAHLFNFLKQGERENLRRAVDYILQRQKQNKTWRPTAGRNPYTEFLDQITKSFAQFTAKLDRDYIFAWLDWDGDNVLIDAGIIDYGSIRQFGLRHDEYRYDDVDRFSTNLNEQKRKSEQIVQTFAQLVDFVSTGQKKPIAQYSQSTAVKNFRRLYKNALYGYFLDQIGLNPSQKLIALSRHRKIIENLYFEYFRLESAKTSRGQQRVPDGVNRPAIYNMRRFLRTLPGLYLSTYNKGPQPLSQEVLFHAALASSAKGRDRKISTRVARRLGKVQKLYLQLIELLSHDGSSKNLLAQMEKRTAEIHKDNRMTGDGLLYIVDEIMKLKRQPKGPHIIQSTIDSLVCQQSPQADPLKKFPEPPRKVRRALKTLLSLIDGHKESI